jgi:hypothetical protein
MTIKALYPTVRPTLNLDFAKTKALDPRVTFTRASTGTFVGSNGLIQTAASGAARFDHNPATGESLGLLVEEARTNFQTYSNDFTNAGWVKTGSTITANATTAPDGTVTASKLSEDTSNGIHKTVWSYGGGTGTSTASIFLKAAERSIVYFYKYDGDPYYTTVNLSNGTVNGNGWYTATITPYPNGWYRVSIHDNGAGWGYFVVALTNGSTNSYAGTAGNGIYIWGAQLEDGSFPTSYIPTVASTVTRAADVASMTGTNFSSWYNQSEGSIMMNAKIQAIPEATTKQVFIFEGNTSTQRILDVYTFSSNTTYRDFYVDNNGVIGISVSNFTANVFQKFARSYGGNNMSAVTAGIVNGTTSTTIPTTIQQLGIFAGISYGTGFGTLSGTIKRLAYYPVRLPDAQLQVLTAT